MNSNKHKESDSGISFSKFRLNVTRIIQSLYYSPDSPAKVPIEGEVLFKLGKMTNYAVFLPSLLSISTKPEQGTTISGFADIKKKINPGRPTLDFFGM
jgi:hypothetical protein